MNMSAPEIPELHGNRMTKPLEADKNSNRPQHAWEIYRVRRTKKILEYPPLDIPIRDDMIRFVCVSDTHNHVRRYTYPIPDGDVLLHSGDFTRWGKIKEVKDFNEFMKTLPHKHKVVIAGNHEMCLDTSLPYLSASHMVSKLDGVQYARELLTSCCYLEDAYVMIGGYKIYGAPWTPAYCSMAFSYERGKEALEKWNLVPDDTDILMTHGPPVGYGDKTTGRQHVGCVELLNTIQQRVKPRYCVYGHIHESHGVRTDGVTTFVNCAICDRLYRPSHSPYIFDLPLPEGMTKADLAALQLVPVSVRPSAEQPSEGDDEVAELSEATQNLHLQ